MKFIPHDYQRTAILWLVSHPEAGLFLEPGLGKSSCTLASFTALQATGAAKKMLVVAPLRVCQLVWCKSGEVGKWDDFRHLRVSLLHGADKQKNLQVDADLYVINYDGLQWLVESGGLVELTRRGVDVVCFDEISKLKHTSTRRFKVLKPHLGRFRRRWGLTGTPVSNGLLDLFGITYSLDLGRALGRFITHYRARYFQQVGNSKYLWELKPGAAEEIYQALEPLALSMKATDCLDLPELVENDIVVDLPTAARKTYDELHRELITVINSDVVTAANKAVALNKCLQVTGGGLYIQDATARRAVGLHDAKLDALEDLVDELQGQPLLVLYAYTHELDRIRERLGNVPAINGATTSGELPGIVRAWNAGQTPVLLAHPAAAGHGLNLQGCGAAVCWYGLTWDFELYDQAIRRVWRQGQLAARTVVHRILARGTVDLLVARALAHKAQGQAALFAALKAEL